ncbi:hypothetical protein BV20DRAFT_1057925 [Pilatotrama ljubarskyi]|nr:hypothetical protein BV20DRAFT_1057925 [Pilatotrama ljubarskyi]
MHQRATIQVDEVRMKVYAAKTLLENIANWWHGLSGRINALQEELSGIRVKLIEKHSRERKKRASQANFSSFSSDSKGLGQTILARTGLGPSAQYSLHLDHYAPVTHLKQDVPQPDSNPPAEPATMQRMSVCTVSSLGGPLVPVEDLAGRPACPLGVNPAATTRPTHHLIADPDLQGLLSLALAHPILPTGGGKRQRAARHDLLLRFGRQLWGGDHLSVAGHDAPTYHKRHPKRARIKAFSRLMRGAYASSKDSPFGTPSEIACRHCPDGDSRMDSRCSHTDCDGDGWEDV